MTWWGADRLTVRLGGHVALHEVSLRVTAGHVIAVVGGDGAGKSTLLRAMVRTVLPDGGEIRAPEKRRIGYLTAVAGSYPDLTVAENIDFAAVAYGVPVATARERSRVLLSRTGLEPFTGRLAGRLSGGMRRKLGVIVAMVHQPDLLVLDEPTTGVDPVSRADVWWLIARAAARGAAVIVTTTYLDEAERATRVYVLDHGLILVEGTAADITAAVPGTIRVLPDPPGGAARRLAWRRGSAWRLWSPDGAAGLGTVAPDLQDAVTVAALAHEAGLPWRAGDRAGTGDSRAADTEDRPAPDTVDRRAGASATGKDDGHEG